MQLSQVLESKKGPKEIVSITPDATVQEAVDILCRHSIGALLVLEPSTKNLVGIVSEKDVLRNLCSCSNKDIKTLQISAIMTKTMTVGHLEDKAHDALLVMTRQRIHHLPVVDGDRVIGILSLGDLLRELYQQDEVKIHSLSDYLGGTYGLKVY